MDVSPNTAAEAPATSDLPIDTPTATSIAESTTTASIPSNTLMESPIITNQRFELDCHVCFRMEDRRPSHRQISPSKMCVLCVRKYCGTHAAPTKDVEGENVCEINHRTYYRNHRARWGEGVFASLDDYWGSL